eukprot:scaffold121477_cov75-Phaeocystis_antarctica.AAC.3
MNIIPSRRDTVRFVTPTLQTKCRLGRFLCSLANAEGPSPCRRARVCFSYDAEAEDPQLPGQVRQEPRGHDVAQRADRNPHAADQIRNTSAHARAGEGAVQGDRPGGQQQRAVRADRGDVVARAARPRAAHAQHLPHL